MRNGNFVIKTGNIFHNWPISFDLLGVLMKKIPIDVIETLSLYMFGYGFLY